jgi:hypothetical protein
LLVAFTVRYSKYTQQNTKTHNKTYRRKHSNICWIRDNTEAHTPTVFCTQHRKMIEFRWGRDFPHLSRPSLRPTQPPVQWVPGLSRELGAAGARCWPLTPPSAEVKNRVELYLYSP